VLYRTGCVALFETFLLSNFCGISHLFGSVGILTSSLTCVSKDGILSLVQLMVHVFINGFMKRSVFSSSLILRCWQLIRVIFNVAFVLDFILIHAFII